MRSYREKMDTLPHERQILEYEETIRRFREEGEGPTLLTKKEVARLEKKLETLKGEVYSKLTSLERLAICRHAGRPRALHYIEAICEDFFELYGDRQFGDDAAIVGGLARIGGEKFMVIGQEKGSDTESRLKRNFGMPHPEGFRKARRLMETAERFHLPVVTLVDTPGAFPGLTAEERGQAWAIAENLREMARLRTPVIVVVIGEAGSGGALAIAIGDRIGMLEHGYYSVISPEGCASILWKDQAKKGDAVEALKLNAENMLEWQIIDTIIPEPLGGAHHNPAATTSAVETFILDSWAELKNQTPEQLVEARYDKFRCLGCHTEKSK
jgi:acetyl-CoA carboxylase carboxyl transferase subunit alpha